MAGLPPPPVRTCERQSLPEKPARQEQSPPPRQSPLPKQLLGQRGEAHVDPPKPWLHWQTPSRQTPLALQAGTQAANAQSGPAKPGLQEHTPSAPQAPRAEQPLGQAVGIPTSAVNCMSLTVTFAHTLVGSVDMRIRTQRAMPLKAVERRPHVVARSAAGVNWRPSRDSAVASRVAPSMR